MDLTSAVVNGIPLLVIIIGLVEFAKKFGVSGKASVAVAMVLGVAFGVAFQLQGGAPVDCAGWFGIVVYGLGLGLTSCGLYDVGKKCLGGETSVSVYASVSDEE